MKKIYAVFLFLSVIVFSSSAQSIIAVPNDSATINDVAIDEFTPNEIHIELVNNTNTATRFFWGMLNYTAPAIWEVKLCDNNNCYDLLIGDPQHVSLSVPAHDTMDFKFQYTAHCVAGTGNTNVYAYLEGDSANTVIHLNYKANLTASCVNGIVENTPFSKLKLFPNPVKNSFTVSGLENVGNLSFEVYDIKGAAVKSKITNASTSEIEISVLNLPKGEYVLKAFDATGKVAGNARLSKID